MQRVIFRHSVNEDVNIVWFILNCRKVQPLAFRLPNIGIELMCKIYRMKERERPTKKIETQIRQEVRRKLKILQPKIRKIIRKMRRLWYPIEKEYFRTVEEITGKKWRFNSYVAYVSPFAQFNFYHPNTRCIALEAYIDWDSFEYIVAHELLHLHIYDILKARSDLPREKLENICELLVEFLLLKEKRLAKFWPKQKPILWYELKSMWDGISPKKAIKKFSSDIKEWAFKN